MVISELQQLTCPVIPVLSLPNATCALPLAEALLAGGIEVMEITLRTPHGLSGIRDIRKRLPQMKAGAGTVLTVEDVKRIAEVGAQFAVSPGFTEEMARAFSAAHCPWLPGVATSSEIMRALAAGYTFLKFFPAEYVGGVPLLTAWAELFPQIRFCPTGGIRQETAKNFLKLSNVPVVGGTWVAPTNLIEAGDWAEITRRAKAATALNQQ